MSCSIAHLLAKTVLKNRSNHRKSEFQKSTDMITEDLIIKSDYTPPFQAILIYPEMIRYLLLQNKQGKTRLSKWYMPVEFEEQSRLENEIHKLVSQREAKVTNFIEFSTYKLITRRYAGLYFTVAVDADDNELLTLETIHFLVETLDMYFKSVCEMDIIFYFYKVYEIMDNYIVAGEVLDINKNEIITRIKELEKLN